MKGNPINRGKLCTQKLCIEAQTCLFSILLGAGNFCSLTAANNRRYIFGSCTQIPLLCTAIEQRLHPCAAPNIERTNPLWPIKLVGGKRKCANAQCIHIQRNMACCLYSICMKGNPACMQQSTNLCNRLQCSHFIIGRHDADENSILLQRLCNMCGINNTHGINR